MVFCPKGPAVNQTQEIKTLRQLAQDQQEQIEELLANPRDNYHTMEELYFYRMLYHASATVSWMQRDIPVVKSLRHHDGELCFGGGWFIVTAQLPTGQVSNHYEQTHWQLFPVPVVTVPPEWDGHTPQEAAERIRRDLLNISQFGV